ncbi:MAG: amidohydrolase [Treponema sp.]|jgi:predicted amidohydrolase YtcJ|nr:amidohydrolase [Treponema sp.]
MHQADLVIKNGNILTMEKKMPGAEGRASALAVSGDRIIGVGEDKDFESVIGPGTTVLDLRGHTVLPGFNDAHIHPLLSANGLSLVNLAGVKSLEEFFARLKDAAKETPAGQWIEGSGYDEGLFKEGREPTIEELDAALPNHPLYVTRACLHVGLANSKAMALFGITPDTPDPQGGEIVKKNGKLTGRLCDAAITKVKSVIPILPPDQLAKNMGRQSRLFNSYGITSTTEMCMVGLDHDLPLWDEILKNELLTVRVAAYYQQDMYSKLLDARLPIPLGNDLFRIQGRKLITDGGGGSGTARMSAPNLHDGKYGISYFTQEQLDEMVWEAHSRGHQVAAHGIGDVAIRMILDAYKKAQERLPRPNARHRLEHCSFCFPPLTERVIKEKVLSVMNPGFLYYFGETHVRNYGEKRVSMEFPFRSLLDGGAVVASGSDCPVTDMNPFPIIYSAVTRKTAQGLECGKTERITAYEAVYSYTAAGAYLTFDEDKKGTLSPGKLADMVVLDGDITKMDHEPERILETKVERTFLGGKTVFERP